MAVLLEMFGYFNELTAARRATPTEDLASAIANATIDGEPLSDIDTVSYYLIIATAGHDTTSATISGGLHALIENPDQLRAAACRHGSDAAGHRGDDPLGHAGQGVHAHRAARTPRFAASRSRRGSRCCCPTSRRNRDEDVFDEPFRFDVGREPNKHNAFGYGVHFCLGAALARMEVNSFFSELIPRLDSIELTGDPAAHRDDLRRRAQAPADPVLAAMT